MKTTNLLKRILTIMVFALLAMPVFAQVGIEEEISKVSNDFLSAYNKGDGAAVGNLFTSNAVRINTDGTSITGADRIKETYRSGFATSTLQIEQSITNITSISRTEAIATGTYTITGNIKANNADVFSDGAFENTYTKVNGVWKISKMQLKDNQ